MKKIQSLILSLIAIFSFRFYEAQFINKSFLNISNFAFILLIIAISTRFLFPKRKLFVLPVQLIVLSVIFSMFMAYLSWGQSFTDSIIETVPFLVMIFFFYLLHIRTPVKRIEKIILFYGILYVILYFIQLAVSPEAIFGNTQTGKLVLERGIYRIIFPGGGLFVLSAFLALNKFTTQTKKRGFWLLFALLGLLIPILQVTRIFIVGMTLIYIWHFIQNQTIFRKIIILTCFAGIVFFVANLNNKLLNGLKSASTTDAKAGGDYVRIQSGIYFISDFSPSLINRIFGNGLPNLSTSDYGHKVELLNKKGYFLEDDGIISVYAMFGILAVVGYIMIWYKSFKVKLPKEYLFVKYYLWYLLISCLTTDNVYSPYYLISTVFALYIFQSVYEKQLVAENPVKAVGDPYAFVPARD